MFTRISIGDFFKIADDTFQLFIHIVAIGSGLEQPAQKNYIQHIKISKIIIFLFYLPIKIYQWI